MPKFYGPVGYCVINSSNGVHVETVQERNYYGDVLRNSRRLQSTDKVNDDINISNQISIVADPFAINNFHMMRYVEFMGNRWKVTDVEVQRPRLILTLGGLYNG